LPGQKLVFIAGEWKLRRGAPSDIAHVSDLRLFAGLEWQVFMPRT